jgi:hypothetical protein
MARKHALFISLAVAAALIAGVFAALRTTELGASAATSTLSDAQISARDRQLDRIQARLDRQARKRPPRVAALRSSGSADGGTVLAVSSQSGSSGSGSHDDEHFDDHGHDGDEDRFDDHGRDEDHGGHGRGRGRGGDDDERSHD